MEIGYSIIIPAYNEEKLILGTPKYYLSVSIPGQRPEMIYVRQDVVEQVRIYLENHRQVRSLIEEISNINRSLLSSKKDF